MDIGRIFKAAKDGVVKHSPGILTGIGIAGFISAIVLAVKATPKATARIAEAEEKKGSGLTKKETIIAAAPAFVPTAVTAVGSAACILGASRINYVRNAELSTAYALSQAMLKKHEEIEAQEVGEEKAAEIREKVRHEVAQEPKVQEAVKKLPPKTDPNLHPFYDPLSNTPFYASTQIIKEVECNLNTRMYRDLEPYITATEMYEELEKCGAYPPIKPTAVSSDLVWYADKKGIKFDYSDKGTWDDGTPCYILGYDRSHRPDYLSSR